MQNRNVKAKAHTQKLSPLRTKIIVVVLMLFWATPDAVEKFLTIGQVIDIENLRFKNPALDTICNAI